MSSIVTLTLNPAIDESTSVAHVISERKLRCRQPNSEPGGGGINVSRVLHRLGDDAPAVFPAGGPAGELLERLLEAEGVPRRPVRIEAWTRENLNVLEEASGRQYRFCMPGPELSAADVERCVSALRGDGPAPAFVVASGSLPPGIRADFYAGLARTAREWGARLVLDTSGEALRLATAEGVYLLKPSLREFQELTGSTGAEEPRLQRLAAELVASGKCEIVVLSLGSGGALWASAVGSARVAAPAVPVASGVGAGDSMVAGIVHALAAGQGVAESVRYGVAAAAASVIRPGTALCTRQDVERLYRGMS